MSESIWDKQGSHSYAAGESTKRADGPKGKRLFVASLVTKAGEPWTCLVVADAYGDAEAAIRNTYGGTTLAERLTSIREVDRPTKFTLDSGEALLLPVGSVIPCEVA